MVSAAASEEVSGEVGGGAHGGAPAITPLRSDTFPPTPEAELSLTIQLSLFFIISIVLLSIKLAKRRKKSFKKLCMDGSNIVVWFFFRK